MRPTRLMPTLLACLISVGAFAAPGDFTFRQVMVGLAPPGAPALPAPPPSPVGNGTSKAGACASGAATGCLTWSSSGVDHRITLSGTPLLTMSTGNCRGLIACTVRATKAYSSGKWYWEHTLTEFDPGYGGFMFGLALPDGRLDDGKSIFYYTYGTGQAYSGAARLTLTNSGHVVGDVFGFALDMDARTFAVTRNGSPLFNTSVPASLPSVTPAAGEDWYLGPNGLTANFGQSNFAYPVPAGFNAGLW